MNIVDGITGAYVVYGAWRGRKRGLADEGYRLLRLLIAFAAGCGLYSLVGGAIRSVVSVAADVSGPVGFAGTMAIVWTLLRRLRALLTTWIAARFARYSVMGGMVAGALRTLLLVVAIAAAVNLSGSTEMSERSVAGRLAGWFVSGR